MFPLVSNGPFQPREKRLISKWFYNLGPRVWENYSNEIYVAIFWMLWDSKLFQNCIFWNKKSNWCLLLWSKVKQFYNFYTLFRYITKKKKATKIVIIHKQLITYVNFFLSYNYTKLFFLLLYFCNFPIILAFKKISNFPVWYRFVVWYIYK